jgi:hypothetical protein
MTDAPVLLPDEYTEHDTRKEQPPDSASDHELPTVVEWKISILFLSAFLKE